MGCSAVSQGPSEFLIAQSLKQGWNICSLSYSLASKYLHFTFWIYELKKKINFTFIFIKLTEYYFNAYPSFSTELSCDWLLKETSVGTRSLILIGCPLLGEDIMEVTWTLINLKY
jgi:hypothetical protein